MKKCPEKEILFAFLDGELSSEELARIQAHLKSCAACAAELKQMSYDDQALRQGIDELFARHRVNDKIMAELKKTPAPQPIKKASASDWWQRALFPALALGLLFLAIVLMIPESRRFHGSVNAVSFHALNNASTVNATLVRPDQKFNLSQCCTHELKGHFLFTTMTENPAEFVMRGNAMVSISDQALAVFSEASLEVDLVKGSEANIVVNGKNVSLSAGSVNYRTHSAIDEAMVETAASPTESVASVPLFLDSPAILVQASDSAVLATISELISVPTEESVEPAASADSEFSEPPSELHLEPASSVEHITNPFTDQPLGQGRQQ